MGGFPDVRLRRLRRTPALRKMLDQALPGPEKFIWPVFVMPGRNRAEAIDAMPGQERMTVDRLLAAIDPVAESGVQSILIFGLPEDGDKDGDGSGAYNDKGVVQRAVREVKKRFPELVVSTDVCLCAYTSHGHCGPLNDEGDVENDEAIEILAKTAVSHAEAGADIVAPSAMMDGQVQAIRDALDEEDLDNTILLSYSTKFASSMYGPFREAEKSAPQKGDRRGYQASYRDVRQAMRESEMDEEEGADMLMIKPSLFYMDVLSMMREETDLPIAAYNVSGEYAMLIATADRGWGDLRGMVQESTVGLVRAGADLIISYWANRYEEIFGQ